MGLSVTAPKGHESWVSGTNAGREHPCFGGPQPGWPV